MNKFIKTTACLAFGVAAAASLGACTSSTDATKALKAQGLEPVDVGGYAMFSCSDDDTFKTKFVAKNAKGETVKGAVCSGWFKGSTIRYD